MNIPFLNDIDLKNNKILNLSNPTADGDAANKLYIDTKISEVLTSVDTSLDTLETNLQEDITQSTDDLHTIINTELATLETNMQLYVDSKIVDNLTTNNNTKILAASQGVVISNRLVELEAISHDYEISPNLVGSFLNEPLNRFILKETYNTTEEPLTSNIITITLSELALNDIPISIAGFAIVSDDIYYITNGIFDTNSVEDNICLTKYNRSTQEINISIGTTLYNSLINTPTQITIYLIINFTNDNIL